jgi:hypothetical protein
MGSEAELTAIHDIWKSTKAICNFIDLDLNVTPITNTQEFNVHIKYGKTKKGEFKGDLRVVNTFLLGIQAGCDLSKFESYQKSVLDRMKAGK